MYHVWMHLEGPEEAASHAYVPDVTELARDLHTRPECSCVFFFLPSIPYLEECHSILAGRLATMRPLKCMHTFDPFPAYIHALHVPTSVQVPTLPTCT